MSPSSPLRTLRPRGTRPLATVAALAGLAGLAAWFFIHRQPGLLVPDGYQYLLMARGIADHLTTGTTLGPGGAPWLPNADASWKPLLPAIIAIGQWLGVPALTAAQIAVALSSASLVMASAAVVWLYTRCLPAALATLVLVAASAPVRHWQSFVGPDSLAGALSMSALALTLTGRHRAAGVLVGLAGAARPEWGLASLVVMIAAAIPRARRGASLRSMWAAAVAYLAVMALVRPPLSPEPGTLAVVVAGLLVVGAGLGFAVWASSGPAWAQVTVLGLAGGLGAVGIATALHQQRTLGIAELVKHDIGVPVGVGALAVCLCHPATRRHAILAVGSGALLLAAYLTKNPDSERYLSQLVPLLAMASGVAISLLPARGRLAGCVAGVVLAGTAASLAPAQLQGEDPLRRIALALPRTSAVMIVGQPEGISFHRPDIALRAYGLGVRGLIVSDPLSRDYNSDLTPVGRVVQRVATPFAVRGRDGSIDDRGLLLVRGVLVGADQSNPREGKR